MHPAWLRCESKERKALPHSEYLVSGEIGVPKTEWLEALLKVYMDLKLKEKAFAVVRRLIKALSIFT